IAGGAAAGVNREHLARHVREPTDNLTGGRIEDEGSIPFRERHHCGESSSRIDGSHGDLPGAEIEGHRLTERLRREVPDPDAAVAPKRVQPVGLYVHQQLEEARLPADYS